MFYTWITNVATLDDKWEFLCPLTEKKKQTINENKSKGKRTAQLKMTNFILKNPM